MQGASHLTCPGARSAGSLARLVCSRGEWARARAGFTQPPLQGASRPRIGHGITHATGLTAAGPLTSTSSSAGRSRCTSNVVAGGGAAVPGSASVPAPWLAPLPGSCEGSCCCSRSEKVGKLSSRLAGRLGSQHAGGPRRTPLQWRHPPAHLGCSDQVPGRRECRQPRRGCRVAALLQPRHQHRAAAPAVRQLLGLHAAGGLAEAQTEPKGGAANRGAAAAASGERSGQHAVA